jgi:hypothetical protein
LADEGMNATNTDYEDKPNSMVSPILFDALKSLEIPSFLERSTRKASINMQNALIDLLETCNEPEDKRIVRVF